MELFPKKHRFWVTLTVSFSPNYIIVAGIAYLAHSWRVLLQIISVFNLMSLVLLYFAFESPRWLLHKGDLEHPRSIYEKIEKFNGSFSESRISTLENLIKKEIDVLKKKKSKKYFMHHLFSTVNLLKFSFVLAFTVFCAAITNYALMYNIENLYGSIFVNNAILGSTRFLVNIIFGVLDLRFKNLGRKLISRISMVTVICALSLVFITQVTGWLFLVFNIFKDSFYEV